MRITPLVSILSCALGCGGPRRPELPWWDEELGDHVRPARGLPSHGDEFTKDGESGERAASPLSTGGRGVLAPDALPQSVVVLLPLSGRFVALGTEMRDAINTLLNETVKDAEGIA